MNLNLFVSIKVIELNSPGTSRRDYLPLGQCGRKNFISKQVHHVDYGVMEVAHWSQLMYLDINILVMKFPYRYSILGDGLFKS